MNFKKITLTILFAFSLSQATYAGGGREIVPWTPPALLLAPTVLERALHAFRNHAERMDHERMAEAHIAAAITAGVDRRYTLRSTPNYFRRWLQQ